MTDAPPRLISLPIIAALFLTACSKFDDPSLQPAFDPAKVKLPTNLTITPYNENKSVFFGDLHIHTSLSTDAFVMGVRSTPDDVYTFAKGGTIEHGAGYPIQISRPLDFAAVTDHSEYMGQAREAGLDVPTTRQPLRELLLEGSTLSITRAWLETTNFIRTKGFGYGEDKVDKAINKNAWQLTIDTAERHNDPGAFTAFIAYEWSAFAGEPTTHMHRNVIYRGSNVADIPYSSVDSQRPEDLWEFLEAQNEMGKTVFAIPHNANLSAGNMYANRDSEGQPLTAEYAAMRNALRVGMELSHSEGFNPFKFGVIGASDSHNASSPADESDYTGKLPMMDGSAGLRTDQATLLPSGINPVTRWGSGGLAGVWAKENTRASLFDALQRKETFATSGPRMKVRFFAGWDFSRDILQRADFIQQAYAMGVPMGGQLRKTPHNVAPSFVVMAVKDPEGANLDRLQIIKAWLDASGASHEKIYDVTASDGRTPDAKTGLIPPVGNTVDIKAATYSNTVGAQQLSTVWTDPDFNPDSEAFYYTRVLEIPTPRWSTYDAKTLGTEPMAPATIQERAVTSAIWYAPR